MIVADDMAKVVVDRTAAVAAFTTAVPGLAWFDRGPDAPTAYPYAVFRVLIGEAKVYSGDAYVVPVVIQIGAYAPVGAAGSNPAAVQQALAACFTTSAAQDALRLTALRNAGEHILSARPVTPDPSKFAPTLREARDVFVCGFAVELLCQGDRSAA